MKKGFPTLLWLLAVILLSAIVLWKLELWQERREQQQEVDVGSKANVMLIATKVMRSREIMRADPFSGSVVMISSSPSRSPWFPDGYPPCSRLCPHLRRLRDCIIPSAKRKRVLIGWRLRTLECPSCFCKGIRSSAASATCRVFRNS